MIGITIFMLAFAGVVVFLYYSESRGVLPGLVGEGKAIASVLASQQSLGVAGTTEIDVSKLEELGEQDYEDLKKQLGVKSDFCIYVVDFNDKVYRFGDKISIGPDHDTVNISNIPCGQEVN